MESAKCRFKPRRDGPMGWLSVSVVQWGKPMNESVARVFDRILRGLGLKTLNAQFLLSYALMFGLAACASVALYLSMSISPETINVAGAQRMLSQKMAREALQLRLGAGDPKALAATIAQYERSAADLDAGNAERNVSRMGAPEIAAQRQKVAQIWGRYRAMLDQVAQPASQVDLRGFSQYSTELLGELNNLVSLMSARADSVQHTRCGSPSVACWRSWCWWCLAGSSAWRR